LTSGFLPFLGFFHCGFAASLAGGRDRYHKYACKNLKEKKKRGSTVIFITISSMLSL
jgi:hypothetical protein